MNRSRDQLFPVPVSPVSSTVAELRHLPCDPIDFLHHRTAANEGPQPCLPSATVATLPTSCLPAARIHHECPSGLLECNYIGSCGQ